MKNISNKIIIKSKIVNCSIEQAWWKWTTHEGLKTFFGKDNKIELTPGGVFEIYFKMENPVGLRGGEGCKILSFLPNKMLSFTWNAPPEYMEIRNHKHKTWVVVNFKFIDNKKTKVILYHLGWLKGKDWTDVYNYFDTAWDIVLEWFDKSCNN